MKNIFFIVTIASLLCSCNNKTKDSTIEQSTINKSLEYVMCKEDADSSFSVIELFSSESCFDCPAAEELFNKMVEEQRKGGKKVILIASHVDYWNDLIDGEKECEGNWVDKYSCAAYTSRQFEYAKQLSVRPVTPQFIINGHLNVDGDNADTLKQKMSISQLDTSLFELKIKLNTEKSNVENQLITIDYELKRKTGASNGGFRKKMSPQIMIYLVERNVTSMPDKAENCGKKLSHQNIARAFSGHTLYGNATTGQIELLFPVDVKLTNCSVLGFVQNLQDKKIIGATNGFDFK